MALTEKELTAIGDQLAYEKLLVTKLKAYSLQCSDPELRQQCETIAGKHQDHYQILLGFLKEKEG